MARSIDVRTSDTDEAVRLCEQVYFPHHLTVHRGCGDFTMSLTARNFGPVAVGLLSYTGPVRLSTGPLETAYQVNVPLTGELATSSGGRRVVADRTTAAVYQPDDDAVLDG